MSTTSASSPAVLFTSVGRRVELVRLFQAAYKRLGLESRVVALDIDRLAPALRLADQPYLVPRLEDRDYIPAILDICRREQVKRVFPLIDTEIPVLAKHWREIEETGARVAMIPPESIEMTADKWETTRFFNGLGLPVPQSWRATDVVSAEATYPLFIKPRSGSASKDALRVDNERELLFFLEYVPDPIVQEFLPGPEITSDVVCDVDGTVLSVVCRRRIEIRAGEVAKGVTVHEPEIIEACVKIAEALQAHGPFTVQCMLKDGRPHFTEINARLGGGFPLGVAAGADSPCWLIARAAGMPARVPPIGDYQVGLYVTRFDDSHFLTEEDHVGLESSHLRPG